MKYTVCISIVEKIRGSQWHNEFKTDFVTASELRAGFMFIIFYSAFWSASERRM